VASAHGKREWPCVRELRRQDEKEHLKGARSVATGKFEKDQSALSTLAGEEHGWLLRGGPRKEGLPRPWLVVVAAGARPARAGAPGGDVCLGGWQTSE
jgi:hypothetical protein